MARADSASAADGESRERALRTLCIRGEILTATPTPPIDEALRRDFEMRLLMEGLGQASHTDDRDWDAMRLEWIAIGAVAPEVHEELERRFLRCLAKRQPDSAQASPYQNHTGRDREPRRERDSGDRNTRRDGAAGQTPADGARTVASGRHPHAHLLHHVGSQWTTRTLGFVQPPYVELELQRRRAAA